MSNVEKMPCTCQICGNVVYVVKYNAKKWTKCRPCSTRSTAKKNIGRKATPEQNRVNSELRKGSNNPFYGKKHTDETKNKIASYDRTQLQRDSAREMLKKNTNTRPIFEIWVEKYGVDGANERMQKYKELQSELQSGENNPMYGKPSPQGSGNGWSGWYNGVFFRSLLELAYLKNLVDSGVAFESGELKKHAINYDENGVVHNYFPDFYLIESDTYVEVKPKNLCKSAKNVLKFNAAKSKVKNFVIVTEDDVVELSRNEILELYLSGKLKWMDRYEQKFKDKWL